MELRQLAVVLDAALVDGVYAKAVAEGKTLSELVGDVLTAYVEPAAGVLVDDTPAEEEIPTKPRGRARKS